jgi:RNA polymerase sigma factor (sigma-70 family)
MTVADVRSLPAISPEGDAPTDTASDRDLLRRFATARDEAAFAEIVRRHRPMLLRLCQRILHSGHDAEDVCQAAFLLLAQQATSPRWHASVAGWLFQTAYRLSLKARTATSRRTRHEAQVKPATAPDPIVELTVSELQTILDEELSRLPEKWRAPILLCCMEGRSRDEAARYLGWTLAAVKDSLEQGRERLRSRLARRGLLLGTAILSTWLLDATGRAACSAVAPPAAAKAALAFATGRAALTDCLPPHVAALAKGGMTTMFTRAAIIVGLIGLALGLGAAGIVTAISGASSATQVPVVQAAPQPAGVVAQPALPQKELVQPAALPIAGHKGVVHALALDRDGKTLATAGADQTVRLWDLATGQQLHSLDQPGEAAGVAFSPDSKNLAALWTGQDAGLIVWDVEKGKALWRGTVLGAKGGAVGAVAFSPDGTRVAAQFDGGVTYVFDAASGKLVFVLGKPGEQLRPLVAFSPDSKLLAVARGTGSIHLVDSQSGRVVITWAGQRPIQALAFLFGGAKVAAADGSRAARMLDVAGGKERTVFDDPHGIATLALDPDSKWVATAGTGGNCLVWDMAAGKCERQFNTKGPVHILALGPNAKLLATAGTDGVVVWDLTREEKPLPRDLKLSAKELDDLWADLASDEAGKAFAAARLLRADPARSVPFLQQHLKPKVELPAPDKLKQLIADLDADEFKKRAAANQELEKLGVLAEPALRAALAKGPPLETKQRVERLLKLLEGDGKPLSAVQHREVRAVRVLEHTEAPEARQLLELLVKASPGWWVRQEAQAALKRLTPSAKQP